MAGQSWILIIPYSNDFSYSIPVNPVDHINMWKNNVDPAGFDYYPNGFVQVDALSNSDFAFEPFEDNSQNDFSTTSSYAQSSAAPSEHEYSHPSRQISARTPKSTRRQSAHSVPPFNGPYADSGFYSQANISPAMEYFPQYTEDGHDFSNQGFAVYDSSPADSMFGLTEPDSRSSHEQQMLDSASSDGETSSSESSTTARNHPLYIAVPADDGLYYCPFAETQRCGHEPKQLKCEYDKYIDSHLKPFRCRHENCAELQFSSTACLLRHEREAHAMHGHGESLCDYPPCNRSMPGNGFRRSYNCRDHMTRCHGWVDHNPQEGKKKRSASAVAVNGGGKISKAKGSKLSSKKQQVAQLKDEWGNRKANLEELTRGLVLDGPLFAMAMAHINNEMHTLKSIQIEWSKLTGRDHIG